jgi:Protein of unknown function (DUF1565)
MHRALTVTPLAVAAIVCACANYSAPETLGPVDGGVANEAGIVSDAVLYVSFDGKDTSPGTQVLPFRTIGGALASVLTDKKFGAEIRVCKGTYAETKLVIRAPVKLLGGFNCSSWTRAAGFPNPLAEDPNETRIENAAPDQSTTTLTIQGARDVTVEGFTVAAVAAPKQVSALYVSDAATGYFRKNAFLGGSGVVTGDSTPCITVGISNSTVTFDDNLLTGGSGVSASQPGAFILWLIDSGGTTVRRNTLRGGSAKGTEGVEFVRVSSDTEKPAAILEDNTLLGGTNTATGSTVEFGFIITGKANAEITRNKITGGTRVSLATPSVFRGITQVSAGSVKALNNLIDLRGIRWTGPLVLRPIELSGRGALEAEGNVVLQQEAAGAGTTIDAIGLTALSCIGDADCSAVDPKARAVFRHNTVHMPASANGSRAMYIRAANFTADNNVFIGTSAGGGEVFLPFGASVSSLRGNAYVGLSQLSFTVFDSLTTNSQVPLAQLETMLGATIAGGNRVYPDIAAVLQNANPAQWQPQAPGKFSAFDLVDSVSCGIANVTKLGSLGSDILGRPRKSTPSAGAYQWQGTQCTPP